ncbi:MAG: FAD binding domain-containing protein, partial [Blastocatellia bacterium]
ELRGVSDTGNAIRIGALTTYTQLIHAPLLREHAPALIAASRTIGAIQIQNRGTIGGNIVNASPAGDSLPVLAAFDATLEIGSAHGVRMLPFTQFYPGYRRTALEPDELLLAIHLPERKTGERCFYHKVGTRRAQAISKVVMGMRVGMNDGVISHIGIGVGSVAPTVVRAHETEKLLCGAALTADVIAQARQRIAGEVTPITDLRSTEHYRRTVTGNVLAHLLGQLV